MKFPLFALGVIAASASFASIIEAQNYPWCAKIDLGDMVENCGFESLEQCKTSLTGGHDFCVENNTYKPPSPVQSEGVAAEGSAAQAAVPTPKKKPQRH